MNKKVRNLSILVIVLAVISLVIGIIFIQQGYAKEAFLTNAMKQEQITIEGVDGIVDNAQKAQIAGDTVREHRHGIAPTYGDLLGDERYDPTDPTQLTYAQALNLENYLYLAVASFGVFQVVKATGAFMVLMGLALGIVGYSLRSIARG
ncbi:MAG TPA: hypothetical protein G4O09_03130 [Dehalococcoidia bacterium]|nr:hypothetical protein [Dehalococcoidia bacterium]